MSDESYRAIKNELAEYPERGKVMPGCGSAAVEISDARRYERASFFDRLTKGMEESIAYSPRALSLRTTALPAPPPPASSAKVVALRKKLKMSQTVFAASLNVSAKLVQSWEQEYANQTAENYG